MVEYCLYLCHSQSSYFKLVLLYLSRDKSIRGNTAQSNFMGKVTCPGSLRHALVSSRTATNDVICQHFTQSPCIVLGA